MNKHDMNYPNLFHKMPNGFALYEVVFKRKGKPIDYIFRNINKSFEKLTDLKGKNIIGQKATVPADWLDRFKEVVLTGKGLYFEQFSPHLKKYYKVYVYTPRRGYLAALFDDITEHKKLEHKLRSNLTELTRIKFALDQSLIVAVASKSGIIESVNDKFVEISKFTRKELLGKTHSVVNSKYHPKEFFKNLWDTILSGSVWHGEIRNKTKTGNFFWVDTTITPFLDENGQPKQFIAILNDITQRKKLEQKKDEFISIASHELKTPLTSAKAYAQVLKRRFEKINDKPSLTFINRMNEQMDRLTDLVFDLLDTTKIQQGKLVLRLTKFNLKDLIKEVINDIAEISSECQINYINGKDCNLTADQDRIRQVITNLLINSVKYSPVKSRIIVKSKVINSTATVSVQDFGIGIPPDEQSKIFNRFYQVRKTKPEHDTSMGLGLFISKEIITRHGGSIRVESREKKGSTFYFTIPIK